MTTAIHQIVVNMILRMNFNMVVHILVVVAVRQKFIVEVIHMVHVVMIMLALLIILVSLDNIIVILVHHITLVLNF